MATLRQYLAQYPIRTFVAVTFLYSWSIDLLIFVFVDDPGIIHEFGPVHGPLIGAVITLWIMDESILEWLGQVRRIAVGIHWYLGAILLVVLPGDATAIAAFLLGADVQLSDMSIFVYVASFIVVLFLAGSLEEFGWRGFAQVRLQRRYNAALTNGAIGLIWATWHLPLFFIFDHAYDPATLPVYFLTLMSLSVIHGWLFNSTGGGLFVVMVAHAASNMPNLLTVTGEVPAGIETVPMSAILYAAGAVIITWYAGSTTLSRSGQMPPVPGDHGSSSG